MPYLAGGGAATAERGVGRGGAVEAAARGGVAMRQRGGGARARRRSGEGGGQRLAGSRGPALGLAGRSGGGGGGATWRDGSGRRRCVRPGRTCPTGVEMIFRVSDEGDPDFREGVYI